MYRPFDNEKIEEALRNAKPRGNIGKSPHEIIKEILDSQQDPEILAKAIRELHVDLLKKLLRLGKIKCPHCNRSDCLTWSCCNKPVLED